MVWGWPYTLQGYKAGFVARWMFPVVSCRCERSSLPISYPLLEENSITHLSPWTGESQKRTGIAGFCVRDLLTRCFFPLPQLSRLPFAPAWG